MTWCPSRARAFADYFIYPSTLIIYNKSDAVCLTENLPMYISTKISYFVYSEFHHAYNTNSFASSCELFPLDSMRVPLCVSSVHNWLTINQISSHGGCWWFVVHLASDLSKLPAYTDQGCCNVMRIYMILWFINSLWPIWWHSGSGNGLVPRHQAITWTNVDHWLVRFCGIHLRAISQQGQCPS